MGIKIPEVRLEYFCNNQKQIGHLRGVFVMSLCSPPAFFPSANLLLFKKTNSTRGSKVPSFYSNAQLKV
jgi:hypothetical protein